MTKKVVRTKMISIVTAVFTMAVMCGMPAVAFGADSGVTKEETVYVVTDSTGAQTDVIVSDHLINKDKDKTISDETTLSDIENVKGEETFKQKGDALTWDAGGKSIYYQGRTDQEVPVTMDVAYKLNNKEVSGSELQGKSGEVEITIKYANKAKYDGTTVPFIVMTGLVVTDESFKNIKISKGKVIDDGDKLLVVGMAAPGLAETVGMGEAELGLGSSVVITGVADKFAVEDMMTVVTNAFFEDLDTGKLGDLDYDKEIKELNKGSEKLVEGSDKLYEGLETLDKKLPELKHGVKQLHEGAKSLEEGTKGAREGAKALHTGIDQLGTSLEESLMAILAGVNQVKDGMAAAAGALTANGVAANNGAAACVGGSLQYINGAQNGLNTVDQTLKQLSESGGLDPAVYAQLHVALMGNTETSGVNDALNEAKKLLDNEESADLDSASELIAASTNVDNQIAYTLSQKSTEETTTLYGGLLTLSENIADSLKSDSELNQGLSSLSKGSGDLAKGEVKLEGGAKQLAEGMAKLNEHADKLSEGVTKLSKGAEKLRKGMTELYDEGIKKIVDLYEDDLKGTIKSVDAMLAAGKGYKTFTKLPSGMDGSVKFIYKTDMTE